MVKEEENGGVLTEGARFIFSLDETDKEALRKISERNDDSVAKTVREMVKNVFETFRKIAAERGTTVPRVMKDLLPRPERVRQKGWERNQRYENRDRIPVFFHEKEKKALRNGADYCDMNMSELVQIIVKSQLKAFEYASEDRDRHVTRAISDLLRV